MNHPVVLIAGALTGLGHATAFAFARDGASVVVSGRRDNAGEALAAELRDLGVESEYVHADVCLEGDVSRLVDRVVERFGRLDIAINNAGTEGQSGPVPDQSTDNFEATFATNASKHAVEGLTKSAALEGAAAGVRVSTVAPGPIQTELLERFVGGDAEMKARIVATIPVKRPATAEEIAQTIAFVASGKAHYLTDQSVSAHGGYTAQ